MFWPKMLLKILDLIVKLGLIFSKEYSSVIHEYVQQPQFIGLNEFAITDNTKQRVNITYRSMQLVKRSQTINKWCTKWSLKKT